MSRAARTAARRAKWLAPWNISRNGNEWCWHDSGDHWDCVRTTYTILTGRTCRVTGKPCNIAIVGTGGWKVSLVDYSCDAAKTKELLWPEGLELPMSRGDWFDEGDVF